MAASTDFRTLPEDPQKEFLSAEDLSEQLKEAASWIVPSPQKALALGTKALAFLESLSIPNRPLEAQVHYFVGRVHSRLGETYTAYSHALQAATLFEFLPEGQLTYENFFVLGHLCNSLGELASGFEYLQRYYQHALQMEDKEAQIKGLLVLGENQFFAGEPDASKESLQAALELSREIEHLPFSIKSLISLCRHAIATGELEDCHAYLQEARELQQGEDDLCNVVLLYEVSGELALAEGQQSRALEFLEEGWSLCEGLEDPRWNQRKVVLQAYLSEICLQAGELEKAKDFAWGAWTVLEESNLRFLRDRVCRVLSKVHKQTNQPSLALKYLRRLVVSKEEARHKKRTGEQLRLEFSKKMRRLHFQLRIEEERREEQHRSFQRLTAVRNDFVEHLFHDLRSPLTSIEMLTKELEGAGAFRPQDARFYGDEIKKQTRRMMYLTHALLNLTRLEARALKLEAVWMEPLLKELVQSQLPQAQCKQIELSFESGLPEGFAWECDRLSFTEAIVNLLSNALKYTEHGGRIAMRTALENGLFVVELQDTGKGIPEELQSRIFERFFRDSRHKYDIEGSGLGLAIVKAVVEQHNGQIELQSTEGEGSVFRLRFLL